MRGLIGKVVRQDWVRCASESMTSGHLRQGLPHDKLDLDVKKGEQLDLRRRNRFVQR